MVTARELQYRPIAPGQEYDFLPRQGRLIDTVPQLSKLECSLHVGELSLRRPANFLDLARMRIDVVNLDPTNLEGGERAKRSLIGAVWGGSDYHLNDMILSDGSQNIFAYNALENVLANGIEHLEGWECSNGIFIAKPGAVTIDSAWPKLPIDGTYNTPLPQDKAREHGGWRIAFREQRATHHAYVDAACKASEVVGPYPSTLMSFNLLKSGEGKLSLWPCILNKNNGESKGGPDDVLGLQQFALVTDPEALLLAVRRESASEASAPADPKGVAR